MPETYKNRLLNRSEVEQYFGVSKRYLEICVARGDGPPIVRIGRLVRYRQQDLQSWIEANTTGRVYGGPND